jgi:hypothetical protein
MTTHINRRSALAAVAAVPAAAALAAPALAEVGVDAELARLIEQHQIAAKAFDVMVDRMEAASDSLLKNTSVVDTGVGKFLELRLGEAECRRTIAEEYDRVRSDLRRLRRITKVSAKAEAIAGAKEAKAMRAVDKAFAAYNEVENDYDFAAAAEEEAWLALCAYQCQTPKAVSKKVDYLLRQARGKEWGDDVREAVNSLA